MNLIMRRRQMMSKRLPYDAEVEYLESTGTQWINTNIYVSYGNTVYIDMDFSFTEIATSANNALTGNYTIKSNKSYRNFLFVGSDRKWKIGYGDGTSGVLVSNITASTNVDYKIIVIIGYGVQNITINGNNVLSASYVNSYISNLPFAIFGTYNPDLGIRNTSNIKLKKYKLALNTQDNVVFDGVPVVKDNIGYLYDKVTGQLFGNQGAGNFILGQDK